MTIKTRSLVASIGLHTVFAVVFLVWIFNDTPKPLPEPIKIHVASFLPPAVVQEAVAPIEPKPAPEIVKTPPAVHPAIQPIKPVAAVQSRIAIPVAQSVPVVPATPIATQAPAVIVPQVVAKETPKVITPPSPLPVNIEREFLDAHLGEIRSLLLQHLKYPPNARRLKMQGEVRVSFLLNTDGSVENIKVVQSSGFDILDEDAMRLIEKTASLFPKPTKQVRINAPLGYVLR